MTKKYFTFPTSWEQHLKTLERDHGINFVNAVARALIQHSIGVKVDTQDPIVLDIVQSMCPIYTGGRPVQYHPEVIRNMKSMGMTNKEIADKLGCSTRTVSRAKY